MIELNTGKITFPELNITLSPLLHSTDFISDFPKDKILRVRDMKNGYIWYDISEKFMTPKFLLICVLIRREILNLSNYSHKI